MPDWRFSLELPLPRLSAPVSVACLRDSIAGVGLKFEPSQVVISRGGLGLTLTLAGAEAVNPKPLHPKPASHRSSPAAPAETFTGVNYENPWPGVEVCYRPQPGHIVKSEYRLAAGFSGQTIRQIRIRYSLPVKIDLDGGLQLGSGPDTLRESAPIAWQEIGGKKISVAVKFIQRQACEVGFRVWGYNTQHALIIDPSLTWNTFLGSPDTDFGNGVVVDGNGNAYVAGTSYASWGTPVRAHSGGLSDAFVAKLDGNGNLIWNAFFGGAGGDTHGTYGIAVDGLHNVYLAGIGTTTWGAPVRAFSGSIDAFAAKLDSGGNLIWNTFLGNAPDINSVAVIETDGNGNSYVAGQSDANWGTPVRAYGGGGSDAFAAKLDSAGNLLWNTFLGGGNDDIGYALKPDNTGNVYVAGTSYATWGVPVRGFGGAYDAFAAKLDSAGNLIWNTFLGGNSTASGTSLALDSGGNVYVGGWSDDWGVAPILRGYTGGWDTFVAKLDGGGALQWHTFLGGPGDELGCGLAVDGTGAIFITGVGSATWGSPARAFSGGAWDLYMAKLESDGSLIWNLFLGGSGSDEYDGSTLALDNQGSVYVAGYSRTTAWGSPVRPYSGSEDAFVAKVLDVLPTPTQTPTTVQTPAPGTLQSGPRFTLLHSLARPVQNETVRLRIRLDQSNRVQIEVYGLAGRKMETMLDDRLPAGEHEIRWRGENTGSGIYILRVRSEEQEAKFKVLVLR